MIKVGYLISYDYRLLFNSLKLVYDHVDRIFLAIDENRKTWSGSSFDIPESFFQELKAMDSRKIIEYYFDDFYCPELEPLECDTRERNMLLKRMGRGWLMQLDVDEYIYDFAKLSKYLRRYWFLTIFPKLTPISFSGNFVAVFKKVDKGFLVIDNMQSFPFVTNQKNYTYVRSNNRIYNHNSNVIVLHQSWARNREEIKMKLDNWGHTKDFDTAKYFEMWKNLSEENFSAYTNFHPVSPKVWDRLVLYKADSINEFIRTFSKKTPQRLRRIDLEKMFGAIFRKIKKII